MYMPVCLTRRISGISSFEICRVMKQITYLIPRGFCSECTRQCCPGTR